MSPRCPSCVCVGATPHASVVFFLFLTIYFIYKYVWVWVSAEARRGLELELRAVVSCLTGYWELNLGPLAEQQMSALHC